MAGNQTRKKKKVSIYDPQKEKIINELASVLISAGYVVRREKLKQGFGWKVMSGACRFDSQELIFVDRRLPQDEQIAFIASKIINFGVKFPKEKLALTPERLKEQLKECFVVEDCETEASQVEKVSTALEI